LTDGQKTAILFEPNDPKEETQPITYQELYERVNQFTNVLKSRGV